MGYLYICLESIILSLWSKWKIKRQREKNSACVHGYYFGMELLSKEREREREIEFDANDEMPLIKYSRRQRGPSVGALIANHTAMPRWRIEQLNDPKRKQSHFKRSPHTELLLSTRPKYHELHTVDTLILISFTSAVATCLRSWSICMWWLYSKHTTIQFDYNYYYCWRLLLLLLLLFCVFFSCVSPHTTANWHALRHRLAPWWCSFRYALTILIGYKCTVFGILFTD